MLISEGVEIIDDWDTEGRLARPTGRLPVPKVFIPDPPEAFVYVPRTLDALALLGDQERADAANWFVDRLFLYSHFGMRRDQFGYTPLKVAYLRRVVPRSIERDLRRALIKAGVIECDGRYVVGQKSFGYRLLPQYQSRHHRIAIQHPGIRDRILKVRRADLKKLSRVHLHLFRQFDRLSLDLSSVAVDGQAESKWSHFNEMTLDLLRNKDWMPTVCEYGRFHTPLTRLMTEYRAGLRLDGLKVINLDLANSQPLFLSLLMKRIMSVQRLEDDLKARIDVEGEELRRVLYSSDVLDNPVLTCPVESPILGSPYTMAEAINSVSVYDDVSRYIHLTEHGQLYDFLSQNSPLSRSDFKETLFKDVFFCRNAYRTALTDEFERLFPNVLAFMQKIKRSNYRRLAWIMQKEESKLMIDGVCGRIMNEHPDLPILTIHDSIMTIPDREDTVRQAILSEFARVGVTPTIRVERY